MHPVELFMPLHYGLYAIYDVTGHLSEGSFVRNVVVQIPKFDVKPNTKLNSNLTLALTLTLCLYVSDKMTLRTSELLPIYDAVLSFCRRHHFLYLSGHANLGDFL